MKQIFSLIGLFAIVSFSFAQNQRFFYDYKIRQDSTQKDSIKSEMMLLDVTKTGSKYYSHKSFVADSISKADLERQMKSGSRNFSYSRSGGGIVQYTVTKSYPDYQTFLITSIGSDKYRVSDDKKPEWKILSEKEKIGEYNTQKASTNYGGREWTAWFSTDIPVQDGPYKFYGLPGLIVKIEDKTGSHVMTLVGNKKFEMVEEKELQLPNGVSFGGMGKPLDVNKEKYKKLYKDYINDPAKNMREMMMRAGDLTKVAVRFKGADGKEVTDPNAVYRAIEKNVKEGLKKNNNPIEPSLIQ